MTIDEMHIKVRQDLQKIDSHANANLLDEEVDFHLNYFTRKFVGNVVGDLKRNPATTTDFQHNQRLLDSLSTLQVKNYKVPAYVDSSDEGLSYGIIPSNYVHLINDASELVYNCSGVVKNKIDSKEYLYPFLFLAEFETLPTLEITSDEPVIEADPEVLFNLSDYQPYVLGINDPEVKYQLVNLILDNFKGNIYWEYYNGKYYKNQFIYVLNSPKVVVVKTTSIIEEEPTFVYTTIEPIVEINTAYRYAATDKTTRRPNRLTKDVNIDSVRNHPFEKTNWESPISSTGNGRFYVYEDSEFKVKNLSFDYIKRPVQLSKAMFISSDLPEGAQQQILETTIIHLKGIIQDPTWQTAMQHNQVNNQ